MKKKGGACLFQLLCTLAFISVCSVTVVAQSPTFFFNNYSEKDGLSDNYVTSIVQDEEGYMWIGTKNGLNRFDGYEFKNYKKSIDGKDGLNNNYITRLFLDSRKRLWVVTFSGLLLYDKLHDNFISYGQVLSKKNIQATGIVEDVEHNLWISTIGEGIYELKADLKSSANYRPVALAANSNIVNKRNFISNLISDAKGNLWLASFDGLFQFNIATKSFTAYHFNYADLLNQQFNNLFLNLYADPIHENILWCGTWGAGLLQFDLDTKKFVQFKYDYSTPVNLSNIVYQSAPQEKNKLWLCTEKGLMIYDTENKTFITYKNQPSEEHSFIGLSAFCLFNGKDGKIWIGSERGFSIMNPEKQIFSYKEYNELRSIGLFEEDTIKKITYLVSIYDNRRLCTIDNVTGVKKIILLPQADEFKAEPFCLLNYHDSLFIGTTKGLYLFNKQTNKIYLLDVASAFGIDKNHLSVYDMIADDNGIIYLASHNQNYGLFKLNLQTGKKASLETVAGLSPDFSFNSINSFNKDASGNIWMASGNSLCKMNSSTNQFEFFNEAINKKYKLMSGITDFTFDDKKNIWITTEENGLLFLDSAFTLKSFNILNGNRIEFLNSICFDNKNNLWINGVQGLLQFNISNSSFRNFTTADGLPSNKSVSNLELSTDDKISFAYGNRVYSFNPTYNPVRAPDYSLKINSLKIFDKNYEGKYEINFLNEIKLNHNQNFISFDFAAIDFSNSSSIQYAYWLEGYDDDWNNCGSRRYASYTNLYPANYKLHIKAGTEQGEWSKHEKILSVIIEPAIWQTLWFKLFSVLLSVTVVLFIVRYLSTIKLRRQIVQLEKQQAIEKVRAHIARDIHDEIGAGLTKISLMSRQLLKTDTSNKNTVTKINEASGNLIQNLSEIVWTINPENDTLQNLIAYTRHYCGNFFDNTNIQCQLDLPELISVPPELMISPDVKRNYLFILKEACNNALKHSGANKFTLELNLKDEGLLIKISDDGKGFLIADENKFGNGLRNMKKRADEVKGAFELQSSALGTIIKMRLPFS